MNVLWNTVFLRSQAFIEAVDEIHVAAGRYEQAAAEYKKALEHLNSLQKKSGRLLCMVIGLLAVLIFLDVLGFRMVLPSIQHFIRAL